MDNVFIIYIAHSNPVTSLVDLVPRLAMFMFVVIVPQEPWQALS